MKKGAGIALGLICLTFLSAIIVSAQLPEIIDACGTITKQGLYQLNTNLEAEASCLIVESDGVTIDCNYHTITYAIKSSGSAISTDNTYGLRVMNCNIEQSASAQADSPAILLTNAGKHAIEGNTIITRGDKSPALMMTGLLETIVADNTFETEGQASPALASQSTYLNEFVSNTFKTYGPQSPAVQTSEETEVRFVGNVIYTKGESSHAFLAFKLGNASLDSNEITTEGEGTEGFRGERMRGDISFEANLLKSSGKGLHVTSEGNEESEFSLTLHGNSFLTEDKELTIEPGKNSLNLVDQAIGSYYISSTNLTIFTSNKTDIKFLNPIYAEGDNFMDDIKIDNNYAFVNSQGQQGFNVPAEITFYNLPLFTNPIIMKDNALCGAGCQALTLLTENPAVINVDSWSSYSIGEGILNIIIAPEGDDEEGGCITDWTCTSWGVCENNQQTRICSKIKASCVSTSQVKPGEIQECVSEIEPLSNSLPATSESSIISRITGAVTGVNERTGGFFGIGSFIVALVAAYGAVALHLSRKKARLG